MSSFNSVPVDIGDEPYRPMPRPKGSSTVAANTTHGEGGWWIGGQWLDSETLQHPKRPRRQVEDVQNREVKQMSLPIRLKAEPTQAIQGSAFNLNDNEQAMPLARASDDDTRNKVSLFNNLPLMLWQPC